MTEEKTMPYPQPMLSDVDYDKFGMGFFSLTDLEYESMKNCSDFLEKLEQALLNAKMVQTPAMIVMHLCCYLGSSVTIYSQNRARYLEAEINNLLRKHAELSLSKFNRYLSNSTSYNQSLLLDQLREDTPGSIIVQTLSLGRFVMAMMRSLSNNKNDTSKEQKEFICPQNKFFALLIPLVNEQHEKWKEDLDGLSMNYAINQLAVQIGWLIGYFSYLDKQPNTNSYIEISQTCIPLYIDYTSKLLEAMLDKGQILTSMDNPTNGEKTIDSEDTASLLNEIRELSEKNYAQAPAATTKLQKDSAIIKAGLEKLVIELITEHMEIKIIYMSVFYFWFTLDAPLRGIPRESLNKLSPFDEFGNIVQLIKKTVYKLPDPEFSTDLKMLNSKMESLKLSLPNPEDLDNVPEDQVRPQSTVVNKAVHTLISDYLKQDYHPEIIANILFNQWLRLSVFYGVSEKEWQKMDYYFVEIVGAVRNYIPEIIKNNSN